MFGIQSLSNLTIQMCNIKRHYLHCSVISFLGLRGLKHINPEAVFILVRKVTENFLLFEKKQIKQILQKKALETA